MKLTQLTLHRLEIPFQVAFQHASATRAKTEGVLVVAESEGGIKGFGEGCPRHYVTDETLDTVHEFFHSHQRKWMGVTQMNDLKEWADLHRQDIDSNPAAWCAVELALLDCIARENNQPVEALLGFPELGEAFRYTAVLGSTSLDSFRKQRDQYMKWGFQDFKVKMTGNAVEDKQKMDSFKELGNESVRVRLDANNLWKTSEEAAEFLRQVDYPIFALEEPLPVADYEGCRKLFGEFKTPIILDESFLRAEQFQSIKQEPETWIINLRVSKMGGLIRSLEIVSQARDLKLPVIVGAQVGETSLLTRAALTVAHAAKDILVAQEGAFGTHLLQKDVTASPLMFGAGGVLDPVLVKGKPGLGIDVDSMEFD